MTSDIEKMYNELIGQGDYFSDSNDIPSGSFRQYNYDEDDGEAFITSKEISEASKKNDKYARPKSRASANGVVEETVYFKRYSKKRIHKYTEKEMENIRKSCENTIVHDYGEYDIYHMSDEERKRNDMFGELSMKLRGLKRTYRRVDQYIEAMRIVVEAWEILEKNNYVHSTKEFFDLVAEGKIVSNRIIMPKLKKIDNYNLDLLIKYISNPDLDPSDLAPSVKSSEDSYYEDFGIYDDDSPEGIRFNELVQEYKDSLELPDDEEIDEFKIEQDAEEYARNKMDEETMKRLLSPEEAEYISKNADNPPVIKVKDIKRKYVKGYDRREYLRTNKKKFNKRERYFVEGFHDMLNKIQDNPENRREVDEYDRTSLITNSMFDIEREEKDPIDDLRYEGSWTDKTSLFLYEFMLREELLKQRPIKERYMTYSDIELNNFFKILEANGVNVTDLRRKMNCTQEEIQKHEEQKKKKSNKKLEAALVKRIEDLNNDPKFKKLVAKAEDDLRKGSSDD